MQNQSAPIFRIVFEALLKPGVDPLLVKSYLCRTFKKDPPVVEKIFRDAPICLKQHITWEEALQYKEKFELSGALCRIEEETPGRPQQPQPQHPAQFPPQSQHPGQTYYPPSQPAPQPPPQPSSQPPPGQQYYPPPQQPPPQQTFYHPPAAYPGPAEPEQEVKPSVYRIEKNAWKSLGAGLGIAGIVMFVPFLSFVFRYLITLVHEIGHAVFGWLYGYPSVPAFDFRYGGGVTMHQDRKMFIVFIVYALLAFLLYFYRRNLLTISVLVGFAALYTISAFTLSHHLLILFMGHGTELVFGGIFLYRALSGSSLVIQAERPLYAFLGFFVFFSDSLFAHRLMTSPSFQVEYGEMKGGGHWMDFSRISHEFLDIKLSSTAAIFLFLCILTPLLTYLFYRYKDYIFRFFNKLLQPQP